MSSRLALWVLVGCIGLTGCANMQTRSGSSSIGNAAGVPPPPMLSNSTNMSGAPQGLDLSAPPQRLDLSEPPPPVPPSAITEGPDRISSAVSNPAKTQSDKPYNLSTPKPRVTNRTISKLASRSSVSSTEADNTKSKAAPPAAEAAKAESAVSSPPAEAAIAPDSDSKPASTEMSASETDADTALLAQPVRKGAAKKESESKSPQSSAADRVTVPNRDTKSERSKIVPVSNPIDDEPVNTKLFS